MKVVAVVTMAGVLAGCASPAPRQAGAGKVTLAVGLPLNATILKRVTATICAKGPFEETPTSGDAYDALLNKAASIGATGIYSVKYELTGLVDRCGAFPGKKASAIAYRL